MFFSKGKASEKIILFNFRSSSVAASIIAINPDTALPKILYTRRENYYFHEAPKPEEFITRAEVALKRLINAINFVNIKEPGLPQHVSVIHILYGSPWYTPHFTDIHYEQSKDFIFTQELFSKMIKNAVNQELKDGTGEIIEKNVVSVLINGYEITEPFNKKAKDVKLSFYFSKISRETKNEIEKIITDNIHAPKIVHHSHPNVLYSFLKHNFHSTKNYILMDVSGEMTEITIIKNYFFKKHVTIPIGSHVFSRKLSEICNYDLHTSWTHMNLYIDNKIDPQCKVNAEVVFTTIKHHWLELIKKAFAKEKIVDIPSTIFIISDNEVRNLIKHIFETSEGYAGTLKIPRKPNITAFSKDTFNNLALYDKDINGDNIISIFANFVKLYKSQ